MSEERPKAAMRWEDWVGYGLLLTVIYLLIGVLFFYAGKEKLSTAWPWRSSSSRFWEWART